MTSHTSIAARSGEINGDDLNWERGYVGMRAYRQSKIACGHSVWSAAGPQKHGKPLHSMRNASRLWQASQELTGITFA